MRLVLRNRQQVETALVDYHNELNHLDVNKCLRLLNERFPLALFLVSDTFQSESSTRSQVLNFLTDTSGEP